MVAASEASGEVTAEGPRVGAGGSEVGGAGDVSGALAAGLVEGEPVELGLDSVHRLLGLVEVVQRILRLNVRRRV